MMNVVLSILIDKNLKKNKNKSYHKKQENNIKGNGS